MCDGARFDPEFRDAIAAERLKELTAAIKVAQELVDDDLITSQDFKEFMFWNPVELHARVNPDFFKGTRVEAAVDTFMREGRV